MTTARQLIETGTPGWYEDPANPGKKTRKKAGDIVVSKDQAKESSAKDKTKTKTLPTGKLTKHPTVVIECEDCGKERTIQVQDKHQVTRCIPHQKEHRNKRRRERRQEKKAKEKKKG